MAGQSPSAVVRRIEFEQPPLDAGEPDPGAGQDAGGPDLEAGELGLETGQGPGAARGAPTREERVQKALDLAYAYINPRDRTVSEVLRHLERRGVSEELAEETTRRVGEQGFLDDERFARLFVADKRNQEQWGSDRIRRGLLSRGIDRHLAEEVLAQPPEADGPGAEPESELDRAVAVLRRRFPDPPQDRRDRNRALGMLLRKGYESELALDALSAYARGD